MSDAEHSLLSDRGLTAAEKSKFDQVQQPLSELFRTRGKVVRLCEGRGVGPLRQIVFIEDVQSSPFLSVPANWFASVSADDLLSRMRQAL